MSTLVCHMDRLTTLRPHPRFLGLEFDPQESLHVGVLALVLDGNKLARLLYSETEALQILALKIKSYAQFAAAYPGMGGFMPWVQIGTDGEPFLIVRLHQSDQRFCQHGPSVGQRRAVLGSLCCGRDSEGEVPTGGCPAATVGGLL